MTEKEWLSQYPVLQARCYRLSCNPDDEQEYAATREQLEAIEEAINSIANIKYREVLTLRYTEGNAGRLMPWRDVAFAMYHNDGPAELKRIQRLHNEALKMVKLPDR